MISIFDWYNQETQDLHYTLKQMGDKMPTIVLEETGFLPNDVISPYQYFCQWSKEGKALYFNQVPIDTYDEITGNNMQAHIYSNDVVRGRINYHTEGTVDRIVKEVLWFNREKDYSEKFIAKDYYNQYGFRYAQTVYDETNRESMKFYYNEQGKIIITENKLTGDTILDVDNHIHIFKRRIDFVKYFLEVANYDCNQIIYNTLADAFLVTLELKNREGNDVLFWHEKIVDSTQLPGNMQFILEGNSQTKRIYFNIREDFDALQTSKKDVNQMIEFFDYKYPFERENLGRKEILILTNSDQIEGLSTLVNELPDFQFHIGALTEMSKKLMDFQVYKNVHLYPNISPEHIEFVFNQCDIYLDINYGNEILNAVRRAFLNNMVIFGFEETIHHRQYLAEKDIYMKDNIVDLIGAIHGADTHFNRNVDEKFFIDLNL